MIDLPIDLGKLLLYSGILFFVCSASYGLLAFIITPRLRHKGKLTSRVMISGSTVFAFALVDTLIRGIYGISYPSQALLDDTYVVGASKTLALVWFMVEMAIWAETSGVPSFARDPGEASGETRGETPGSLEASE